MFNAAYQSSSIYPTVYYLMTPNCLWHTQSHFRFMSERKEDKKLKRMLSQNNHIWIAQWNVSFSSISWWNVLQHTLPRSLHHSLIHAFSPIQSHRITIILQFHLLSSFRWILVQLHMWSIYNILIGWNA